MFGKLTISAIPYTEPIILGTLIILTVISLFLVAIITYFKKWIYIWNNWITSVDHKKVGIMYMLLGFMMLIRGFIDAVMMRIQQFIASMGNNSINFLSAHHYNQIFTVHGVIMIFFVAMPLIISLMNFIIPLQIGARDVAFPFLNNLSFWLTFSGALLINISLGVGEFAETGWLAYPPLSGIQYSPGVGVDYWIWSLQISGIGTLLTGINFLVTILKMRAVGMNMFKMPVFTWASFCSNILIVASFPVLTVVLTLLTLDRYLNFHFFTNEFGGNVMMYVNLIWIWGHPEVYILILPIFGVFSEVVSTFSRKSLFGYFSLVWATIAITVLSFIVWLHHFFTMGASANINAFFGITTMIIAIPTGVKIFNWLFTMYQGRIHSHSSMLWTIGFLITFSIGGMTGVILSLPAADFILHNSVFVVAHFHNVIIGGVVFGCFAAINYWFPKMFGFCLDEKWGIRAFWLWLLGFFLSFMPLYFLGFMGMTRRISQAIDIEYHNMLTISFIGVFIIALGIICQIIQIYVSCKYKILNKDITGDPWNGRTLEWSTKSPPPFYNFAVLPIVKEIDCFWKQKQLNNKRKRCQLKYKDLYMPKNTSMGFMISIFSTILGFSNIWHIWWLSIVSTMLIIFFWIKKVLTDDSLFVISKEKIKDFESNH